MRSKIILSVLVLLFVWNCDKSSTNPETSDLVGTWNATTETNYWGSISNPDSTSEVTYSAEVSTYVWQIKSDNTFHWSTTFFGQDFMSGDGTWSTTNDQLTMNVTVFGTDIQTVYTYEISGSTLTVTEALDPQDGSGDWSVFVFNKQ